MERKISLLYTVIDPRTNFIDEKYNGEDHIDPNQTEETSIVDIGPFQKFVEYLQTSNISGESKWNPQRENYIKENLNKRRIVFKEINQIDFTDPLSLLDESYVKETYNQNLFVKEVKDLDNLMCDKSYTAIIDRKEKLEMIKKIIEYYLNYIVELNFDAIMKALQKLTLIENNLSLSFQKVSESNKNYQRIKRHLLVSSSKFILLKQKLKNLLLIHDIIKGRIINWSKIYNQIKEYKTKSNFTSMLTGLNEFQEEIFQWSKSLNSKRNLIIAEIFLQKSKKKLNKLQKYYKNQLDTLFVDQKENFLQLYSYYTLGGGKEFISVLYQTYKKTIKTITISTLTAYAEQNFYSSDTLGSLKDLSRLRFEENKLVQGMNRVLRNLSKVALCYSVYAYDTRKTNEKYYDQMIPLLIEKKNFFYEKLEKTVSKILIFLNSTIREFNVKRSIILIVLYLSLFSELIKSYFNVEYSKYIHIQTKNMVMEHTKYQNIKNIKKLGILLSGDNMKRVALQDDHEFFSHHKIEEKAPFFFRNFLSIFNDVKFYVNRSNIRESFANYMEAFSSNSVNSSFYDECSLSILSKPLVNKKIILCSSSITLIKCQLDLVMDLIFYDSTIFETFIQIFNLYDYYILASINMLVSDRKYFLSLFEDMNIEEIRKRGRIEQGCEQALFLKRFTNLHKFLRRTKKNLEVLFQSEIDLTHNISDEGIGEMNQFQLPKQMSSYDNNVYSNLIESIVMLESIYSVYKIIKRLGHFSNKLELEFQSSIILETIRNYKVIISELRIFMYKPLCNNIFKIDPILNKIINYRWNPKEDEEVDQLSEPNPFVDNIFQEFCEKFEKLSLLSGGSLTEKSERRFFEVMLLHINEKLLETFSKIKRCNSTGRSIMLKDIKFLKSKLEFRFNKDLNKYFSPLMMYINSWYYEEEEFLKYTQENCLNYKYLQGIFNSGPTFAKFTRQNKSDYTLRLDEAYLGLMERIKHDLDDF